MPAALLALLLVAAAEPVTLHVAPDGQDAWSGALAMPNAARTDGPLASLAGARDALRRRRAAGGLAGGATVLVQAGTYALRETLIFTPADSGTAEAHIVYRAAPGARPLVSGGRAVTGWRAEDGSWVTTLPAGRDGGWYFRQLWAGRAGEALDLRRYRPHRGMKVIAGLTYSPARKTMAHRAAQPDFKFFAGDLAPFANLKDVELVALHSWSASRLKIAALDPEQRVVTLTSVPTFRIGYWYAGGRNPYYLENVREDLGRPGEWYLDRPTGTLTYRPLPGETLANTRFVAPVLEKLVVLQGDPAKGQFVDHLTFEGLTFAHSEWPVPDQGYDVSQGQPTLPAAIEASGARDCRFVRCTVAHTGAYAIGLGLGCARNAVTGGLFYDLGGGGVKVGDSAMPNKSLEPLLPVDNAVENNLIRDFGLVHYSANGIWCGIVKGTRIRHNEVCRGPYTGIACGWCWGPQPTSAAANVIEGNLVHDVMQLVQDGGGIYTLGRQPGTLIRGNVIHSNHQGPFACADGQIGLYFDEGSSGFLVENNIVYDVSWENCRIAQNQNKAADHVIRHNTLGVLPTDPAFPRELAAQAGLEPAFRDLADPAVRVTPNPVYAMTLPPLPPVSAALDLDFESVPVGQCPQEFQAAGFSDKAKFAVTDEVAASGRRCLKIQDAAGQARSFYPYVTYGGWQIARGPVTLSFDLRQSATQPGEFGVEFRDYATRKDKEFLPGPSLSFQRDGRLRVGGQELATLPLGQWTHLELRFSVGAGAAKTWTVTVTLPDKTTKTTTLPFGSADFAVVTSLYLIGADDREAVTYLDNLKLGVR